MSGAFSLSLSTYVILAAMTLSAGALIVWVIRAESDKTARGRRKFQESFLWFGGGLVGISAIAILHDIARGILPKFSFLANIGSLLFMLVLARRDRARELRSERREAGQCPDCGYSLEGNTSGRCPECGATTGLKG